MARFLIEVPHEARTKECALAAKILIGTGSQYLAHADFGCLDGEHKAWIIVEVGTKEEARFIVPPLFRPRAKIVQLNKFSLGELEEILECHEEQPLEEAALRGQAEYTPSPSA
ncbi:hypothetical protein [Anaerobaca lacustris]|uniref:Uncharacterized protein n=1 Tax=Anaerobaca lacustris TaxID=3044600 RepID=A0AAW6U3T0_9BACT|nr:hypothetical protein [Sedimentisphaerales bacterium M17dextr]